MATYNRTFEKSYVKKHSDQEKDQTPPRSLSAANPRKSRHLVAKLESSLKQSKPELPIILGLLTEFMIHLPCLKTLNSRSCRHVEDVLIDYDMKSDLEEVKAINWCRTVRNLYPIKTLGDGNCLLHAVSMAMWGVKDSAMLLRRLLYIACVECQTKLHDRWQRERQYLDREIPDEDFSMNSAQWEREWSMVIKVAEDRQHSAREGADHLPLDCLEEFHVFVLANVLRRPIIVLSDRVVRSLRGSALSPNNFGGVYLPLLWHERKCVKSPLLLGYHMGHFTPLVGCQDDRLSPTSPARGHLQARDVVPLVTCELENTTVHFLLEEEEKRVHAILQKYLDITEVNWTRADGVCLVLAAKLNYPPMPEEYDLMRDFLMETDKFFCSEGLPVSPAVVTRELEEGESLFRVKTSHVGKRRDKVKTWTPGTPAEEEWMSGVEEWILGVGAAASSRGEALCITEGCQYYGAETQGGRCHECLMDFTRREAHKDTAPQSVIRSQGAATEGTAPAGRGSSSRRHTHPPQYDPLPYFTRYENEVPIPQQSTMSSERRRLVEDVRISDAAAVPSYASSMTNCLCNEPRCTNMASTATFPFCHEHKAPSTPAGNGRRVIGSFESEILRPLRQVRVEGTNRNSLDSWMSLGTARPCPVPNCVMYGLPEWGHCCSQHKALGDIARERVPYTEEIVPPRERTLPMSIEVSRPTHAEERFEEISDPTSEICMSSGCQDLVSAGGVGYCPGCKVLYRNPDPVKPDPFPPPTVSSGQWEANGDPHMDARSRRAVTMGTQTSLDPETAAASVDRPSQSLVQETSPGNSGVGLPKKCIAPMCNSPGMDSYKGLCLKCYQILKETIGEERRGIARELNGTYSKKRHQTEGRSRLSVKIPPPPGLPRRDSAPNLGALQQPAQAMAPSRAAQRHDVGVGNTALGDWRSTVPTRTESTERNGEYLKAMKELEASCRASVRRCKVHNCRNYGNASKRGYCNECFEECRL